MPKFHKLMFQTAGKYCKIHINKLFLSILPWFAIWKAEYYIMPSWPSYGLLARLHFSAEELLLYPRRQRQRPRRRQRLRPQTKC